MPRAAGQTSAYRWRCGGDSRALRRVFTHQRNLDNLTTSYHSYEGVIQSINSRGIDLKTIRHRVYLVRLGPEVKASLSATRITLMEEIVSILEDRTPLRFGRSETAILRRGLWQRGIGRILDDILQNIRFSTVVRPR